MDHKEARHNAAEMTEHKVIATVEHILNEAGDHLTSDELEKLCHCWKIEKEIYAAMTYAKQVSPQ